MNNSPGSEPSGSVSAELSQRRLPGGGEPIDAAGCIFASQPGKVAYLRQADMRVGGQERTRT